jgi:hypothetical protein
VKLKNQQMRKMPETDSKLITLLKRISSDASILAQAITEQQRYGQICPQTMSRVEEIANRERI